MPCGTGFSLTAACTVFEMYKGLQNFSTPIKIETQSYRLPPDEKREGGQFAKSRGDLNRAQAKLNNLLSLADYTVL
jgi:hypothetical protein